MTAASDRSSDPEDPSTLTSVADALAFFRRTFPVSAFTEKIPPIIWRHLLYALRGLGPRTEINRQLVTLAQANAALRLQLLTRTVCAGAARRRWIPASLETGIHLQ